MTTAKSALVALGITVGIAVAAAAIDAMWMLHQQARGVPGENAGIDLRSVGLDIVSTKGLLLGLLIFLFTFAVAKIWRDQLRG
ncbi:MAG TPA: hypothetical protein VMU43_14840 [Candidatus Acidoferrum sp.]|nr:hypothetical protein [Candidatus Acidoferrum sp.]